MVRHGCLRRGAGYPHHGKGINSGYVPLGAVGISDAIFDTLKDQFLYIGLTYSGHPLACAAAVATIKAYQEEKLIENARHMGVVSPQAHGGDEGQAPVRRRCPQSRSSSDASSSSRTVETREPIVPWNATGEVMSAVQETLTGEGSTCIFAGTICLWSRRSSSMQSN